MSRVLSTPEVPELDVGDDVTVRYSSVYGGGTNGTELSGTVERVDLQGSPQDAVDVWFTVYVEPAEEERDRRRDLYKDANRPPRRLKGVVMEEGDTHIMSLECRNGGRWNRLSTGADPVVVLE